MASHFYLSDVDSETLDAERKRVRALIDTVVSSELVHEVGSTSVEGLIGKQDLDFFVRVPRAEFVSIRNTLDGVFDRNLNQLSNDEYQGYKVESTMDVAIQLTVENGRYDNFLAFRNALQQSEALKREYNSLKMEFNGSTIDEYRTAKQAFIERVLSL